MTKMTAKGSGWSEARAHGAYCRTCDFPITRKPTTCTRQEHHNAYENYKRLALKSYYAHKEERSVSSKLYKEYCRKDTLLAYGGKCACCGFSDLEKKVLGRSFLEIDKVDGGHKKLKITLGIVGSVYSWLKKNGYPKEYRVLCRPCNVSMEPNQTKCEYHKWLETL